MKSRYRTLAALGILLAAVTLGCSCDCGSCDKNDSREHETGDGEHDGEGGEHGGEARGEHDRDGEEHHGDEGEESGAELALDETYDSVRNGVRLILAYDGQTNSFKGTVENTTPKSLERVRVEVHLSNGIELGPTTPSDLAPGAKRKVTLAATEKKFDRWTAHPEVGSGEHDREGGGEHR